ncbi:MAG TPA: chemotaxis protein CheX [Dehalococcoidales bacterium]|nr:chemotaxis protein CheX [Dehalococcoidales bacterium]
MTTQTTTGFTLDSWTKLAKLGSTTAVSGLSQMLNKDFTVTALSIEEVSFKNAHALIGKPNNPVIGIYLLFTGHASGQILLTFDPKIAFELVDMALGVPVDSTTKLGEMERSVLGEMGNIVGAFFLNSVADCVGSRLMPSPPVIVQGPAGAMIGAVLAKAAQTSDSIFVIKLMFHSPTKEIEGHFLVLPSFEKRKNVK